MLTFKPLRSQGDGLGDIAAQESGLDTGPENLARQDFRDDTDINTILRRHGIDGLNPNHRFAPIFTDNDDSIDLQQVLDGQRLAQRAWEGLPESLRQLYPSIGAIYDAINRGELNIHTGEVTKNVADTNGQNDSSNTSP